MPLVINLLLNIGFGPTFVMTERITNTKIQQDGSLGKINPNDYPKYSSLKKDLMESKNLINKTYWQTVMVISAVVVVLFVLGFYSGKGLYHVFN